MTDKRTAPYEVTVPDLLHDTYSASVDTGSCARCGSREGPAVAFHRRQADRTGLLLFNLCLPCARECGAANFAAYDGDTVGCNWDFRFRIAADLLHLRGVSVYRGLKCPACGREVYRVGHGGDGETCPCCEAHRDPGPAGGSRVKQNLDAIDS